MTYEEIWQKIKAMSQRDRKMLAYEVSLSLNSSIEGKEAVGYIHPHYYFDAKAVHDILFYAPHSQHEIVDKDGKFYQALKEVMDNDKEIHVHYKRHGWLLRYINDKIESNIVKDYISHRAHEEVDKATYSISPVQDIAGERQRTMIITRMDGGKIMYKMTACNDKNGFELMTFTKIEWHLSILRDET